MTTIIFGQTLVFWSGALVGLFFIIAAGLGLYSNFVNARLFPMHKKFALVAIPLAVVHIILAILGYWFGWFL